MTFLPEPSESAAADRQSDGLTTDEARRRLAKIGPNATPRIGILTVPRGPVAWQKGCRMRLSDLHEASDVWVRWPASAGSAEASGEPPPSGGRAAKRGRRAYGRRLDHARGAGPRSHQCWRWSKSRAGRERTCSANPAGRANGRSWQKRMSRPGRTRPVEGNDDLTLAASSNRVTTLQLHHRVTDNRLAECDHRGNVSSFRASWRRAARPPHMDHRSLP